jgi:hypothetical protein
MLNDILEKDVDTYATDCEDNQRLFELNYKHEKWFKDYRAQKDNFINICMGHSPNAEGNGYLYGGARTRRSKKNRKTRKARK